MKNDLLKSTLDSAKIEYDEQKIEALRVYAEFLVEYNEKVNLTAVTDDEGIAVKHFEDSLALTRYVNLSGKGVDVGTGAGFPGLPLAVFTNAEMTLVDALQKRLTFLDLTLEKTGVKAHTVHERAEDAGRGKLREQFDFAVSRAVANLAVLCEYCLPLVKVGGVFYAYKGINADEEIKSADRAIKTLGGEISEIFEFSLTNGEKRKIIAIKKISQTPTKYPRKTAQISKQPI